MSREEEARVQRIVEQALKLPREARLQLVAKLLASLVETSADEPNNRIQPKLRMTPDVINELSRGFFRNPPLESFGPLDEVEASIRAHLPADYKAFLQFYSNGGEGDLKGGYLTLLRAEELLKWQGDYRVSEWMSFAFLFGHQDGEDAFGFDLRRGRAGSDYPVFKVSLSSRDANEIEYVGRNFADFIDRMTTGRLNPPL